VSLVTVFANGQAVLKADCGTSTISTITWYQNIGTNPAISVADLTVVPTTQDIYYTTAITTGTSTYTAVGNRLTTPIPAGKAATITTGLTAAERSSYCGRHRNQQPGRHNCTNAGGATARLFAMGTPVTLHAVQFQWLLLLQWQAIAAEPVPAFSA